MEHLRTRLEDWVIADPVIKKGVYYRGPRGGVKSCLSKHEPSRENPITPFEAHQLLCSVVNENFDRKNHREAWDTLRRLAGGYAFMNDNELQSDLVAAIARAARESV